MVCTGNCIKGADGKMVGNMDALYATPLNLHNTRLVVLYGALHGVLWQADVKSADLQAPSWWRWYLVGFAGIFAPFAATLSWRHERPSPKIESGSVRPRLCRVRFGRILRIADEQCWMAHKTHRKELAEVLDSACSFYLC